MPPRGSILTLGPGSASGPFPALNDPRFGADPIQYGADPTGAADSTPGFDIALNQHNHKIVLGEGTFLLDTPLFLDRTDRTLPYIIQGNGATRLVLGSQGLDVTPFDTYDAGTKWLVFNNTLRSARVGGTINPGNGNMASGPGQLTTAPHLVVRDCIIDGQAANRGFVWGNGASTVFEGCDLDQCKYGMSWSLYTDCNRMSHCYSRRHVAGQRCMVALPGTNGDGIIIDGFKSEGGAIVADLTSTLGASIRGGVGGGYRITSCKGVEISGYPHVEQVPGFTDNQPAFLISNSHVVVGPIYVSGPRDVTKATFEIADSAGSADSHSDLTFRNLLSVQYHGPETDPARTPVVLLTSVNPSTRIRFVNPTQLVQTQASGRTARYRESILVTSAVGAISAVLAAARHLVAASWELRQVAGAWEIVCPDEQVKTEKASTQGTVAVDLTQTALGTLTPATVYEYAIGFRDLAGNYSQASAASSGAAPASGTIGLDLTIPVQPTTVVVWRKTAAGVLAAPGAYVEIPADAYQTKWFDTGVNINGRPWLTAAVPVPNTVALVNHTVPHTVLGVGLGPSDFGLAGSTVIDTFTANGTWTKRAGLVGIRVMCLGAGGGGGSGRRGAAGSVRNGGGSGSGGAFTEMEIPAALLSASHTVSVSAGGAGGVAQTADDTDGLPGTAPTTTFFGAAPTTFGAAARGGAQGLGGTAATGTAAGAGVGMFNGAAGAVCAVGVAGTGVSPGAGGASGGAGGGITAANAAGNGGAGGFAPGPQGGPGATGGVVDTTAPQAGQYAPPAGLTRPGTPGGGGAASITAAAQAGGASNGYAVGGAGGGASLNGNNSGAGAAGAAGIVLVINYF